MKTKTLLSTICALAAGLGTAVSGVSMAIAAPLYVPAMEVPVAPITPVNHDIGPMGGAGAPGYLHGHRGYREWRQGYRRHDDGWWYPPAAFALGAIIGGAMAAPRYYGPRYYEPGYYEPRYYQRRVYRAPRGSAHVRWCQNRYRSYRAWDNTFQPYHGPRRQCWSPYS